MRLLHEKTNGCIKPVAYNGQRDYVYAYMGKGCKSFIGRKGGRQDLSLGQGRTYNLLTLNLITLVSRLS